MSFLAGALVAASRLFFVLAGAALAAMVATTAVEVVLRYLFDAPTHWAADSVGYLLALAVALALPEVTRQRGHVAISFLSERAREGSWAKRGLSLAAGLVVLATAWIVSEEAARQGARGVLTQGAAPIPKAWITWTLVVGLGLSGLLFLKAALGRRD